LLNTIAVTVGTRALLHSTAPPSQMMAIATLHGYSVAFWWAAGFFGLGTIISLFMLESGASAGDAAFASSPQISGQG
jgi:hypothetical protein